MRVIVRAMSVAACAALVWAVVTGCTRQATDNGGKAIDPAKLTSAEKAPVATRTVVVAVSGMT
ncbi:MAG: hypothetical protein L0Z62_04990 [Gemmataceae bacterium]|nr:hypothetical protein [Gemmataceae bacterium]